MAGPRAELGEFVAVGVCLAFCAFGSGPEVGAQLVTGAGGFLLRQPDGLFGLFGPREGLVPVGLGGAPATP